MNREEIKNKNNSILLFSLLERSCEDSKNLIKRMQKIVEYENIIIKGNSLNQCEMSLPSLRSSCNCLS